MTRRPGRPSLSADDLRGLSPSARIPRELHRALLEASKAEGRSVPDLFRASVTVGLPIVLGRPISPDVADDESDVA